MRVLVLVYYIAAFGKNIIAIFIKLIAKSECEKELKEIANLLLSSQ